MTGAIPKYGKNFRRERAEYIRGLSHTRYVLKRSAAWSIRSDITSEKWVIYWCPAGDWLAISRPFDTFTEAMAALVAVYERLHP